MQSFRRKTAFFFTTHFTTAALLAMTMLILGALSVPGLAQTYDVIHAFTGGAGGSWPWSEITIGPGGQMYGTTFHGGDNSAFFCQYGCGIVYNLQLRNGSWVFKTLHEFQIQEGANPHSGVIIGPDGALYGTTLTGGLVYPDCDVAGCGTLYRVYPPAAPPRSTGFSWNLKILYDFTGGDNDGGDPSSGLVMDQAGNMYGANGGGPDNCGLIFQLSRSGNNWNFSQIYNGFYCPDGDAGIAPGGMLVDSQGNLYGVTANGGHPTCTYSVNGCGTVFKLTHTQNGWVESTLYEFNAATDGAYPGGLVMDHAGNLYAGTETGGPGGGGTVWELSPSNGGWNFQVLHSFESTEDIAGVIGRMAIDPSGSLYGVTQSEGQYGYGNFFKLTPSNGSWNYTSLHDFAGGYDGAFPLRGPTIDSNNNLFGTTYYGGASGGGVIWEYIP